jgi:multicomponent Na+:H+ antiporter subunit E
VQHLLTLFFSLCLIWLLWSGHYTGLVMMLGLASCILTVYLSRRLDIIDGDNNFWRLGPRLFLYWFWLLWQIFKANIAVARIILSPRLLINPTLVRIRASQRSDLTKAIFANSITLTPGTVSLQIDGDSIIVHALTRADADTVADGNMDLRATALEGKA